MMNIFIGCLIFTIGVFVGIALMCILQVARECEEEERRK